MRRPARAHRAALLLLLASACTRRLYEGPLRTTEEVAVIQVGTTTVREIDGERRRGGAFDVGQFEVAPGHHRLLLVLEMPARSLGLKTIPAQSGTGVCVLEFNAEADRQYYLGSRPRGDWPAVHWDGAWEGWVRDPTVSSQDDVIARCTSQPAAEAAATTGVAAPPPAPLPVAASPGAAAPAAAAVPAVVAPVPAPAAVAVAPAPVAVATTAAARATPTTVAAPAPGAAPGAPMAIRLGEWNLRSLGRGTDKDVARVAAAIEANFDILAVTEVLQVDGGHPGYDALRRALGPAWDGQITATPRPNSAADGAEYYAVLYRRERVRACSGWDGLRYTPDNDGSDRASGPDHFLREPAFGCYEAGDPLAPGVDFLLAAYRAPVADGDAGDVAAEVAHLDDAFTAMKLARPGEDDLIIAGDFHLESVELPRATRAADRTRGDGSLLNLLGDRTASLPDHILVYDPRATAELLGDAEPLDVRGVAPSNAEFYRTVSDHLPIMVRLRASGPDDD